LSWCKSNPRLLSHMQPIQSNPIPYHPILSNLIPYHTMTWHDMPSHHITSQPIHTDTAQKYLARLMSPSVLWNIFLMECLLFMHAAFFENLQIFKYSNMKYINTQIYKYVNM
jgi:hypothetical protein